MSSSLVSNSPEGKIKKRRWKKVSGPLNPHLGGGQRLQQGAGAARMTSAPSVCTLVISHQSPDPPSPRIRLFQLTVLSASPPGGGRAAATRLRAGGDAHLQSEASPWSWKPSGFQNSSVRETALQLLSRWGDRFLVLPASPSSRIFSDPKPFAQEWETVGDWRREVPSTPGHRSLTHCGTKTPCMKPWLGCN